ncbi:MAG: DUF3300 domain-containing protein, partial [Gammaproteobacteria bacterium]|nr:DUF3300 domain-containing protein [Gammaproteobacteria bacterium]
ASFRTRCVLLFAAILSICLAGVASASPREAETHETVSVEPVEPLTGAELEALVAPVALYPDDLLAIVLPASTFPLQIVLAARFLEEREVDPSLEPDAEWDASIVALLNYPEIVALLDRELKWTWQLGEAVLLQQEDVIAAVADFRAQASAAGNLKSDEKQVVSVSDAGTIEIAPAEPEVIYVPYYDPVEVVSYQPRRVYHYYPRAYPVYYYPYPSGHYFSNGAFWGVTSAFSIGWYSRSLHWHHHGFHDHPYFGYSYYDPFYYRRPHVWLNVYHRDRLRRHDRRHHDDNRWRNDDRHRGSRPGRRPDRRGVGSRPGGTDARPADGLEQPALPPLPAGRGIERTAVAMPGKRSGHIPVHIPVKAAGRVGASSERRAGQSAVRSQRTAEGPVRSQGTRRMASSARPQTLNATTGQIRQRPVGNAASGQSRRISTPIRKPANVQSPAVSTPIRRPANVRHPAVATPIRKPVNVQRPAVSTPIRKPANVQRPAVSTQIRRPADVQRPAVSPRLPARERPPRATRPASVRKPTRNSLSGVQQRQRPKAPSPGARAAPSSRGAAPAVSRNAIASAVKRHAARAARSSSQPSAPQSALQSAPRNAQRVAKPPPAVRPARASQQREARQPERRRPKNLR